MDQMRSYTINKGMMDSWVKLFETGTENSITNTTFEVELVKGDKSLFTISFEKHRN